MRTTSTVFFVLTIGAGALRAQAIPGAIVRAVPADSIVPTAPVATLSELLTGRVAGLTVLSRDGSAGAGPLVVLRSLDGPSAITGPLLIIDGVRVDGSPGRDNTAAVTGGHPATARFDDLDPAAIDHIDVLPGAAAAALFGPGGGNGAILVSTRRAAARPFSGAVMAEGAVVTTPVDMADGYASYGHRGDTAVACPLAARATAQCTLDSVTHFNPLTSSVTSPLHTVFQERVGGNVGAAVGPLRVAVAGHYVDQPGTLRMPDPDIALYTSLFGVPPTDLVRRPSRADRGDVRGSVVAQVGHVADVDLSAGYIGRDQRDPAIDGPLSDAAAGSGNRTTNDGWFGPLFRPARDLAEVSTERIRHSTGGLRTNWRPAHVLTIHAVAGVDAVNQSSRADFTAPSGGGVFTQLGRDHEHLTQYTTGIDGTLSETVSPLVRSRLTVGLQYLDTHYADSTYQFAGANGASQSSATYLAAGARTQSVYLQEVWTLDDRLVVGAGGRWDHERLHFLHLSSSSINPSLDASWALIGTASDPRVRVRGAFGQTSTLPDVRQVLPLVFAALALSGPPSVGGFTPDPYRIRAERQRELEIGADATLPGGRFTVGATLYARRSTNVLLSFPATDQFTNTTRIVEAPGALVSDRGAELTLGARLVDRAAVVWEATLDASANANKVLHLNYPAPLISLQRVGATVGRPMFGVYGTSYTYADANHDGVIEPGEITSTASGPTYVGPAAPTRLASASTSVQLFKRRLRVAALVDYRGGYVLPDNVAANQGLFGNARALNVSGASLDDQAKALSLSQVGFFSRGIDHRVTVLRWRELSATVAAPGASFVQVTLAVRNLALWTNYHGGDPDQDITAPTLSAIGLLHLPQPRTVLLRVSAGF